MPPEPPADPEDWTDEQWLAYLHDVDADEESHSEDRGAVRPASPSATSALVSRLVGGAMVGMYEAIYGAREEIVQIVEADGEPLDDDPIELHLVPDHPEESSVIVRQIPPPHQP